MKRKICFVLPEYARATHFQYVAEFIEALAVHADVMLVVEKGTLPAASVASVRIRQHFQFPLLRFIEIAAILFLARLRGYRTQYVHYSFSAAFWSSLITRVFGGTTFYWNAGMPWLYQRSFIRNFFERLVYRLVGRLVTGAEGIVDGYVNYYHISRGKIIVIPNWIDEKEVQTALRDANRTQLRKELNIPLDAPVALFVHRLSRRKGAHLLPEIFAALPPHTILIVVGDGPEQKSIKESFRERGVFSRVRMCGWVPQTDVIKYFALGDIFLLPSEEEGCPHVLLESLAAGVPYVAVSVGGVQEMTPPLLLPYVTPPGKIDEFIHATTALIQLPTSVREKIIREELEWVKRYNKEEILKKFIAEVVSI